MNNKSTIFSILVNVCSFVVSNIFIRKEMKSSGHGYFKSYFTVLKKWWKNPLCWILVPGVLIINHLLVKHDRKEEGEKLLNQNH